MGWKYALFFAAGFFIRPFVDRFIAYERAARAEGIKVLRSRKSKKSKSDDSK